MCGKHELWRLCQLTTRDCTPVSGGVRSDFLYFLFPLCWTRLPFRVALLPCGAVWSRHASRAGPDGATPAPPPPTHAHPPARGPRELRGSVSCAVCRRPRGRRDVVDGCPTYGPPPCRPVSCRPAPLTLASAWPWLRRQAPGRLPLAPCYLKRVDAGQLGLVSIGS